MGKRKMTKTRKLLYTRIFKYLSVKHFYDNTEHFKEVFTSNVFGNKMSEKGVTDCLRQLRYENVLTDQEIVSCKRYLKSKDKETIQVLYSFINEKVQKNYMLCNTKKFRNIKLKKI